MLTTVILDGPMGKQFGRQWKLAASSANEALQLIDANKPGVFRWIRSNLEKHSHYRVVCSYEDGREEELTEKDYTLLRRPKTIRFVPLVTGAGGKFFNVIAGVVLIVAGAAFEMPNLIYAGGAMLLGAAVQALVRPSTKNQGERKDKTSYAFDGAVNTTEQGVPVSLIFGRCRVGSHAVSAALLTEDYSR